ncbi:MAG: acetate--CoA ligase [Actinobacteria bacterium]|nr:acetate--CoA ligase [Actinomycetota bacterium]
MADEKLVFPVPENLKKTAWINSEEQYNEMYKRSVEDADNFWAEMADELLIWNKKWDKVQNHDWDKAKIAWFEGGKLNATYNCLDRWMGTPNENKVAYFVEGDHPDDSYTLTYRQLYDQVTRIANGLAKLGVKKGDRVSLYLPMIPQLPVAMLACARLGAIHSVCFGGFSAEALRDRLIDAEAKVLITTDGSLRGGKKINAKGSADTAMAQAPSVEKCIVVKHTGVDVNWVDGRDMWWEDVLNDPDNAKEIPCVEVDAEDPLFILYTSGSTGKPKGVVHTTGGYLLQGVATFKYAFDYHEGDVFFCTADIGWVTGHTYCVYAPLIAGATSVLFEGVPSYPDYSRFWKTVERYKVNQLYTAPTALRAIAKEGDQWLEGIDMSSLRILGSVGEPINPEVWLWYYNKIGGGRCPIVDTWWQTETGSHLLLPLPGAVATKPGSVGRPFFGVQPELLDPDGALVTEPGVAGNVVIKAPWPGMMRGMWGDPERFFDTYFAQYPGYYTAGDGGRRDEDGDWFITGRVDDVINVSGHRMGTAEIESALVSHDKVSEAAVVGMLHDIKGEGIYAYVTLNAGVEPSDALKKELVTHVRKEIGPIASPDAIQWAPGLPKTRSGKIMRRILKKIAKNDLTDLGDTSTLAEPEVVDELIENRLVK